MKRWTPPVQVMTVHVCDDGETEYSDPGISHEVLVYQRSVIDCLEELPHEYNTAFDTSPGHKEEVEHHISTGDSKPVLSCTNN